VQKVAQAEKDGAQGDWQSHQIPEQQAAAARHADLAAVVGDRADGADQREQRDAPRQCRGDRHGIGATTGNADDRESLDPNASARVAISRA
jgi:hypothetical protein